MTRPADVLVLDLDGTLLGSDGLVSDRNRHAVRRARDAGLEVIIATGRTWIEARAIMQGVDHDGFMIAAGGSVLCRADTGETLDRCEVCPTVVADVAEALVENGHRLLVLKDRHATGYDYLTVGSAELDPASAWWFRMHPVEARHIRHLHGDEHPEHSLRVGAVATRERLEPIAKLLRDTLGPRATLQHWGAVTEREATGSATHLLEVFAARVNKWTMVERLCAAHGFDVGRIAAVGDGLNDRELIAGAAVSYAMGNADDIVRASAHHIVAHHDHAGVAEAIDHLLS
jgi:hypothetical protein